MSLIAKFFQCLFCWRVKASSEEEIRTAEVVLGQSFGLREDNPGESNRALAEIAERLHSKYGTPLVLQWEIADQLPALPIARVIRRHTIKGKYLDTYEVLSQSMTLCRRQDWKKAVMLAHSDHYWRCLMVAKKLGFEVLAIDTSSVPYDKLSSQSWTRSRIRFIPREIVARFIYLITGKI